MSSPPPPSVYGELLVDSDDTDYDTYFNGQEITSTAASLASQVTDYRYENGRRYHAYHNANAEYWAPNDEVQSNQEEIFHHVYTLRLDGSLYVAPLEKPKRILDLGCGAGLWCLDMANDFPDAEIIGNDLSPIQPTYVPPNVNFEVDDFNQDWVHPANSFDYIHARALYGSVTDWDLFLKRTLRTLKPGGWFESVETVVEMVTDDDSLAEDSYTKEWVRRHHQCSDLAPATFDVAGHVEDWCRKAGFTEITQRYYKVPLGPWPKDKYEKTIGSFNLANMLNASEGFSLHLHTKYLGVSVNELLDFLGHVKAELTNRKHHIYFRLYTCVARKPEESESRPDSPTSTLRAGSIRTVTGDDTDAESVLEREP